MLDENDFVIADGCYCYLSMDVAQVHCKDICGTEWMVFNKYGR